MLPFPQPSSSIRIRHLALALFVAVLLAVPGIVSAGEKAPVVELPPAEVDPWLKPTADIRARYEFGEQDLLDASHAATLRSRLGLLSREWHGLQLFAEYEGTLAADRNSYRAASVHGPAGKTVIADPESHEFNQLWLRQEISDGQFALKLGRQAINLDNQRYVGGVAWRQNMQTFDAAVITARPAAVEGLEITYGYVWQVNRIFGSDVTTPIFTDFEGSSHLINASYAGLPFGKLTAYSYLLDLHNDAGDANSSNSYGLRLTGDIRETPVSYAIEYACQTDAADSPLDYAAHYVHGTLATTLRENFSADVGVEYLGDDNGVGYRFPLGTNHKFNGFADRFLNTPASGLTDLYASVGGSTIGDIGARVFYHHFRDADFDAELGNEVDLVLSKKLRPGVVLLAKGAYFWSPASSGLPDTTRASLELGFTF